MSDFIRARSQEQKEDRLKEIKDAADFLFCNMPYSKISLSEIAEKLNWSRANLYKYVTTKEDIYLDITSDKMDACYSQLIAAFPENNNYSLEVAAEVYVGILNVNKEYLRYVAYLMTIIEQNVTVERLAKFKSLYYQKANEFTSRLSNTLKISFEKAYKITVDILYYASSYESSCYKNPLIQQALKLINVEPMKTDFYQDIKDYILMQFNWATR